MLINRKTNVKAIIIRHRGMYYAECTDGNHINNCYSEGELVTLLKTQGFEEFCV